MKRMVIDGVEVSMPVTVNEWIDRCSLEWVSVTLEKAFTSGLKRHIKAKLNADVPLDRIAAAIPAWRPRLAGRKKSRVEKLVEELWKLTPEEKAQAKRMLEQVAGK